MDAQRKVFENLGCIVEEAEPNLAAAAQAYDTLRAWSYVSSYAELMRKHRDQMKDTVIWEVERGLKFSGADIAHALKAAGVDADVDDHSRWAAQIMRAGRTLAFTAAGLFAWLGAISQHSGAGLGTLLNAGLSLVPPAIVVGGIGVLAFGAWPRRTSAVVYTALAWSVLADIAGGFGGSGAASRWLLDTSVFHQMGSAPAESPNWAANGVMVAGGVACALLGGVAFGRRDLQSD